MVTRRQARQAQASEQQSASAHVEPSPASSALRTSDDVDQGLSDSLHTLFEGGSDDNRRQETVGLSKLSVMQRSDASLKGLFQGLNSSKSYHLYSNGLLMRRYVDAKRGSRGQEAV